MAGLNLLGTTSRVATPFIKITIGQYTFGVYDKKTTTGFDESGYFKKHKITYPNYVQSLSVRKINGQVNQYTLNIKYPITQGNDPNFFEKVFSSVSKTREIKFSYGDLSAPNYIYKDEIAIITDVKTRMTAASSIIDYTVSAVSSAVLSMSGTHNFQAEYNQPSEVIKRLLKQNATYGLQDVFYGMRDYDKVIADGLIPGDDLPVNLEYKANTSIFDYLKYLVSCMINKNNNTTSSNQLKNIYSLVVIDDTSGDYDGPYFKIFPVDKEKDALGTYEIDIGYPSQNIVTEFNVDNDESYSILYDYSTKLNPEKYSYRVDRETGELEEVFSPSISSGNSHFLTRANDMTWWSKVTSFPIKATITIKGLLRPAILMTHVRLNVYFYGHKHISSGLYIITQQNDTINEQGYKTTLSMLRISGDDEFLGEK